MDDFADEVVGRGDTTESEVCAEFNTVGAASLGRKGFVEGGAAGLDEERCPVKPGMTIEVRPGMTIGVRLGGTIVGDWRRVINGNWRRIIDWSRFPVKPGMTLIIVFFRVTLGKAGDEGKRHGCRGMAVRRRWTADVKAAEGRV